VEYSQNKSEILPRRFLKFSYVAIFFILFYSVINFVNDHILHAIIDVTIATLIILNLLLKKERTYENKIYLILFIGMSLFIFIIYDGGTKGTGWLWSLTFPAFSFLLNNKQKGLLWTLLFGIILLFILFFQEVFNLNTSYDSFELFVLICVYIVTTYLIYLFQNEVDSFTFKLEELNEDLENRVIREIQKNKKKDEMLYLQAKQAQMGEMVSMIAHQWRQPLNAISASSMKMKLENEMNILTAKGIDETSEFIQDKTQSMSEVINSFLDFSKPIDVNAEFILSDAIDKSYDIVKAQLILNSIDVEIKYEEGFKNKILTGSESLLEQVLLNLFVNSKDAFNENDNILEKKILILVDEIGSFKFQDNAGGIPIELREKVFNPYFTTKEDGKGTGLGLYTSREIMKNYFDGDLIFIPVSDGSSFEIIFNKKSFKELL